MRAVTGVSGQTFVKFKDAYGENKVNKMLQGTRQIWETCSGHAQPFIISFLIDCVSKKYSFGMRFGYVKVG